jgi:RNA polymerase sigma factor (sigma-70 family)
VASVPERATQHDASEDVINRGFAVQLLTHLSQRQRAAIVMRFFHDMDDEEIAVSIGCRRVTVRSLISRGLVSMRKESDRIEGVRQGVSRGSLT